MRHLIEASQLTPDVLDEVFERADFLREQSQTLAGRRAQLQGEQTNGINVLTYFAEESTRTRLSFERAAIDLGASVISVASAKFSSMAKGETLEDTIRVVGGCAGAEDDAYADIVVLRHSDDDSSQRAAAVSKAAIINAGAGKGEHPTQAALDAYTIQRHFGRLAGLNTVIGGDLLHGRTVNSLVRVLSQREDNSFTFVSSEDRRICPDLRDFLVDKNTSFVETDNMFDALTTADVVYWTRDQKERHMQANKGWFKRWRRRKQPEMVQDPRFVLGETALHALNPEAIIMHPLPKVSEIGPEVDDDPRAKYFPQAWNGVPVRKALIQMVAQELPINNR